ncbi:MAG: nucleotidyltransferase family protein [Desulfobacterales bacterium]|jgi:molybdenum cofactor cytidylyltransferase
MTQIKPTAGIILAAGAATRFGQPKQLLRLKDKYLIERVLDAALNSRLGRIVLVLGYAHQKILQALGKKAQHSKLHIEVNPHYTKGQSHSLRVGLSTVRNDFPAVIFLLGDQPMLNSGTINTLLERFWSADKDICVPAYRGQRKNPVIFGRRFYGQLMDIKGDIGARQLIDDNPEQVFVVEIDDPLCFFDIDTPQDFDNLKKKLEEIV